MKKKQHTYLLLVIVLGVWGTIAYKIIVGLKSDEVTTNAPLATVLFSPKTIIEVDTFSISKYMRDPFLGRYPKKKQQKATRSNKKQQKATTDFPRVIYKGKITKQQSSESIYILEINGKQYLLREGKQAEDIKLLKGAKQHIMILYKGHRKNIPLTQ